MTVTNEAVRRRELELQRGAARVERAERVVRLQQYLIALNCVAIRDGEGEVYYYRGTDCIAVANFKDDSYPTDTLLATLALVVQATVGMDALPAPEDLHGVHPPDRAYRNWLHEHNKNREDFK